MFHTDTQVEGSMPCDLALVLSVRADVQEKIRKDAKVRQKVDIYPELA